MKTVWIIDEVGAWEQLSTRQVKFCSFFQQKGYKTLIICGSKIPKTNINLVTKKEGYRFQKLFGVDYLIVHQPDYVGNGVKRVLSSIAFQKKAIKIIKKMDKPDVVFLTYVGLFGNEFLKLKTKYNAQLFTDVLDLWPESFVDFGYITKGGLISRILYKMEKKAYKTADYCIFSQEGGKDYILEKKWEKDIPLSKVLYLNNGVDLKEIEVQQTLPLNNSYNQYEKDKYFKAVYIGSISKANNVELIISAAESAETNKIKVHFYIFGDGSLKNELENICKSKKLSNVFFMGRSKQIEAQSILIRADAAILSFANVGVLRFGSCNNKLFMYMAAARPIISTVSSNYDLIKNNNLGIVVEPNKDSLVKGIVDLMNLPNDKYNAICDNCKRVITNFDYNKMLEEIIYPLVNKDN